MSSTLEIPPPPHGNNSPFFIHVIFPGYCGSDFHRGDSDAFCAPVICESAAGGDGEGGSVTRRFHTVAVTREDFTRGQTTATAMRKKEKRHFTTTNRSYGSFRPPPSYQSDFMSLPKCQMQ